MHLTVCVVKERGKGKKNEPRPLKQCQFPFKFDGETFNGCIDFILKKNGDRRAVKPWCSTKVDESTRQHVKGQGFYGDCDSSPQCPNVGGFQQTPLKEEVTDTAGKNDYFSCIHKSFNRKIVYETE